MENYRFCSTDLDGSVRASCVLLASSDDEAREIAKGLLKETQFHAIEAWRGLRMIYRVAKDG